MEDPPAARNERNDEEEERRRREEEMERMLLEQEAAEDDLAAAADHRHDDDDDILGDRHNDDDLLVQQQQQQAISSSSRPKLSYATLSFSAAFGLLWYALRTRQQWYLALVFLGSSKYAYIVLGNAIIATCMQLFDVLVGNFLNGLRLVEREGLSDFFRWNITETCLALTMFRSELTVESGIYFLLLVLGKCLHWVVEQRESHLRMTQDAVTARGPDEWFAGFPKLHSPQLGLLGLLQILIVLDVIAVVCCIQHVATHGPSVQLLFGFESAILLVSAMSLLLLAGLHVLDGLLHYMHDTFKSFSISSWKDRKATLIFAMEVQAQGAKFVFYVTFFLIVFTYYGLPMNLFREVYTSFQQLRLRLVAFGKYRKLVKSMNRYPAPDEALLADDGEACIICRDDMCARDCKQLPGCGHIFHTSCLREWLVQQQTCPTCRGDISVNEARAKKRDQEAREAAAVEAAAAAGLQESVQGQEGHQDGQEQQPAGQEQQGETIPAAARMEAAKELRPTGQVHGTPRLITPSAPPAAQDDSKQPAAATTTTTSQASSQVFPALYKVVGNAPAPVYNLNNNNDSITTPVRHVTPGTAILCLEMELQTVGEDLGLMMRIPPNEWIWENQLEYLTTIPT